MSKLLQALIDAPAVFAACVFHENVLVVAAGLVFVAISNYIYGQLDMRRRYE